MAKQVTQTAPIGRFSTAPSLLVANRISSNDAANAARSATFRYEQRVQELEARFQQELQGVRDAFLQELAAIGMD